MELGDYLIDHAGLDWGNILASWHWLLPQDFTLWIMNRFGDLFIVLEDGTVHMLDAGAGTLERVAANRDEFAQLINQPGQAEEWLMMPLVDALVATGRTLGPGECYSYRQLPVLGGDYTVENMIVESIRSHYAAFGPIHEKIKDLPEGTQVRFEIEP